MNIKKLKRDIERLVGDFEKENETTILDIYIYTETTYRPIRGTKVVKRTITFLCE